uniref:Uncharacterized protein n=1 Tax=Romanomermis culicivorax TaxID=13658 RepID=A0A915JNJ8_ROMCU
MSVEIHRTDFMMRVFDHGDGASFAGHTEIKKKFCGILWEGTQRRPHWTVLIDLKLYFDTLKFIIGQYSRRCNTINDSTGSTKFDHLQTSLKDRRNKLSSTTWSHDQEGSNGWDGSLSEHGVASRSLPSPAHFCHQVISATGLVGSPTLMDYQSFV